MISREPNEDGCERPGVADAEGTAAAGHAAIAADATMAAIAEDSSTEEFARAFESDAWLGYAQRAATSTPLGEVAGYRIDRLIQRGGQGVVYEATEVRSGRRVAIKRLLWHESSTTEVARFARETEVLATLAHPHVVGLLAAPEVDGGRLLVMEWIDGLEWDAWADAVWERLAPREASRVIAAALMKVASAVAAAHAKGILHRDLKPANVIVTGNDEPKVLDFGLAKEIGASADGPEAQRFAGTPSWTSPEQVALGEDRIDARSDVHALGLLLYRALAGTPAFDPGLPIAPLFEAIRSTVPPPPLQSRPGVSKELDLITLHALEKDPARRCQTADALTRDLSKFLRGEAIEAHPPSGLYALRKLVSRHRLVAALSLIAVAALVAGSIAMFVSARRTEDAHVLAEARAAEATMARGRAERMNVFFQDLLSNLRERDAAGSPTTAREIIGLAVATIAERETSPEAELDLRLALGGVLHEVGDYEGAIAQFRRAVELLAATDDRVRLAEALALLMRAQQRAALFADSLASASQCLEIRESIGATAAELADTQDCRAMALVSLGRVGEASQAVERGTEFAAQSGDPLMQVLMLSTRALALEAQGNLREAARVAVEAAVRGRSIHEKPSDLPPRLLHNAAYLLTEANQPAKALPYAEESLALRVAQFRPDHPSIAIAKAQLARTLATLKRYEEAIALLQSCIASAEDPAGLPATSHANFLRYLATVHSLRGAEGDNAKAIATLRAAVLEFARCEIAIWSRMHAALRTLANVTVRAGGRDALLDLFSTLPDEVQRVSLHSATAALVRLALVRKLVAISPGLGDDEAIVQRIRSDVAERRSTAPPSSIEAFDDALALADLLGSSTNPARKKEGRSIAESVEREASAALGTDSDRARDAREILKKLAASK